MLKIHIPTESNGFFNVCYADGESAGSELLTAYDSSKEQRVRDVVKMVNLFNGTDPDQVLTAIKGQVAKYYQEELQERVGKLTTSIKDAENALRAKEENHEV